MSYDIPDEIKYKEKIVFGLDVKQMIYACGFLFLAFFSTKLPLQGILGMVLPLFFLILGFGFVYLNFEESVWSLYRFNFGLKEASSTNPKAQDFIGVKAIAENVVFLSNGECRAIVQVSPVNFALLEENQRKALILNYREFLNHLTTPIQILVKTKAPDLEAYFTQAQKRLENALEQLRTIFDDFLLFEHQFLQENNVMERSFYLIVCHKPKSSLIGKAHDELEEVNLLEQRTKIIQEKLGACGLQTKRLQTSELTGFFSTYSSQAQETNEAKSIEKQEKSEKT